MSSVARNPLTRFMAKVEQPDGPDGCWLWTGALSHNGYGFFRLHPEQVRAHRWSYEHFVGPIPDGLLVCHHCDVRRCVNPAHLYAGTQKENLADMTERGRAPDHSVNAAHLPKALAFLADHPERRARGERQSLAKLTEANVREIRTLHETTGISQRQLATRYHVGQSCISAIIKGQTWKHVS